MDYPDYDPTRPTPPLSDAELDTLDELLQALPGDAVMNIEALDGYLTAMVVGPMRAQAMSTAQWLPAIWGGDPAPVERAAGPASASAPAPSPSPAPFASGKQKKRAVVLALRHLHDIEQQLQRDAARWEPVFSVAETDDGEFVDAEDWCAGFLQAVALQPAAWAPLFDDEALAPLLQPLVRLGADPAELSPDDREGLDDAATRDALSRAALEAALALHQRRSAKATPPA